MLRNLAIITVSALAVSACTYSSYGPDEHRSVESAGLVSSRNVDVTGDAEFAGMIVRADGDIDGDLDVAGATVRSNADVGGNLSAAGARLRFNGTVAGDAEIAAATAHVDAIIEGHTEIAAARLRLDGEMRGPVEIAASRATIRGRFLQGFEFEGHGNRKSGDLTLAGEFLGGGAICSTEIEITSAARFEGDFLFVSDSRPDRLPSGAEFIDLDGRDCEKFEHERFSRHG
ncbi:polymer-forming cytoskeletal protein [Maricaulis sp.]|uniref:polymer-forming cytoskeletal protein n=1 Tax=unclassified Maricaulis TaxID=2632371 RepID=UPI001B281C6C|nr:polymer-forming cytoskeletal protein [Maricaulis sp.]MBO6797832.1 polymer-forming cytoskeletal protein [Maricaulis sp.]